MKRKDILKELEEINFRQQQRLRDNVKFFNHLLIIKNELYKCITFPIGDITEKKGFYLELKKVLENLIEVGNYLYHGTEKYEDQESELIKVNIAIEFINHKINTRIADSKLNEDMTGQHG